MTGFNYIDQSDEASPVDFVVGAGDTVFPGWDEGVTGMKVGGKRQLIIPPDLAMGTRATADPPNATLVMEIDLVTSASRRQLPKLRKQITRLPRAA